MAPGGSNSAGYNSERTLITNQFWGENSSGDWSIEVLDTNVDGDSATISNAKLDIYGTCDQQSPLEVKPFSALNSSGFNLNSLARKFLFDGGATSNNYKLLPSLYGHHLNLQWPGHWPKDRTGIHSPQGAPKISAPTVLEHHYSMGLPGIYCWEATARSLRMEIRFVPKKDMILDWKAQFGSEDDEWSPSVFDDKVAIFFAKLQSPHTLQNINPKNLLEGPNGGNFSVNGFSKSDHDFKRYMQMNEPCGPLSWEYDGTTQDAWTSKKAVLQKGKVYAIAPMIADAQDHIYDSGVIIGPNAPTLKPFDRLPELIIKDLIPSPRQLGKDLITKTMDTKTMDTNALSQDQIESTNWNKVNLARIRGKGSFDYDKADWNAIINSDGFGERAAATLRTDLLPSDSLSDAARTNCSTWERRCRTQNSTNSPCDWCFIHRGG